MVRTFRGNHTIYQSCGNTRELGTAFLVMGDMQRRVIGWWPIDERMCRLRIKGRFFNVSIINVHSPHSGSTDDDKDAFYAQLEREYDRCPNHDVKIIIGDLNAQVGQEEEFRPTIGKFSAHQLTNENGLRLFDFAASKNMAIRSTFFQHSLPYRYTWRLPQQTESQIDHVLIDGRHFSDIIDVRTYRGANIDSDHYLVMVKLCPKLSVINNVQYRRPPRYDLERLKQPDVATAYAQNLEAALPDEGVLDVAPLEDSWSTVKAAINNAAESTIGYVERSRRNDWVQRIFIDAEIGKSKAIDQQPVAYNMTKVWWKNAKQQHLQQRKMLRCYECGKLGHIRRFCVVYKHKMQKPANVTSNIQKPPQRQKRDVALITNESGDCIVRVPIGRVNTDTQERDNNQLIRSYPFWELPVAMPVSTPVNFIIDSGATNHMCREILHFKTMWDIEPLTITTAKSGEREILQQNYATLTPMSIAIPYSICVKLAAMPNSRRIRNEKPANMLLVARLGMRSARLMGSNASVLWIDI
ncbi:uncharacterized protein LOC134291306 [Aedes albopictus]|uniref:CCHC-type domain-containing protein n=1 Tax=Aedes albopictus TaxID=7160 RepID=A0ABM1Y9Q2_AEDAL